MAGWPGVAGRPGVACWPGQGKRPWPFFTIWTIRELSGNYPGTIQELSGILPNGPGYLAWPGPGLAGQAGLAGWPGLPSLAGLACLLGRLLITSCIDFESRLTPFVVFTTKTNSF